MKPRFHKSRVMEGGGEAEGKDDDGDDDDDDDYDDDDDDVSAYNLRKVSAAALDNLAKMFGSDILPFFIPFLNPMFSSPDWRIQEASILALGAIADGCLESITDELPPLFGYLLNNMLCHPRPLIRAITTWTIGKYSSWILREPTKEVLPAVVEGLLQRVLDHNKKVQEDACSNLAILEEEAGRQLIPFLKPMLQVFEKAFAIYQKKNMIHLLDVVGSLAESVGDGNAYLMCPPLVSIISQFALTCCSFSIILVMNNEVLIGIIIPPLIKLWNSLGDDDSSLTSLFECLTSIAISMGPGFMGMAPGLYDRCIRVIEGTLLLSFSDSSGDVDKEVCK
jgi:transportin-1